MTSRLPPKSKLPLPQSSATSKPSATIQQTHPTSRIDPASSKLNIRSSETFKKRRTGLWAVGVAIIVGAGAIIGARLKEVQQTRARIASLEQNLTDDTIVTGVLETNDTSSASLREQTPSQIVQETGITGTKATSGGTSPHQRQVAFLEDRRGVLMKQKFDLERKIERVREKRRREEEMEGRRSDEINDKR